MSNTSKLSHEINNYLSVICSEMQLIESKYKELSRDRDWIAMKQDTWQLGNMLDSFSDQAAASVETELSELLPNLSGTNQILKSASFSPEHKQQTEELFSIHNLLQSLSHSWKLRYSKKGFRLIYINQHQETLQMRGTPFEIVQIFNNLLSNSYDALSEKKKAKGNSQTWFPEARLILCNNQNQIVIKLEDNGFGIPEDTLSHIFEYGFTTKTNGHGIGLSVVQELVNKHHGHIYVHSHQKKGCDFHLIFPAVFVE